VLAHLRSTHLRSTIQMTSLQKGDWSQQLWPLEDMNQILVAEDRVKYAESVFHAHPDMLVNFLKYSFITILIQP